MGRKLFYKSGSYYMTDDRTGFPQRAERIRKEWTGLQVDKSVWEIRQPQDFVRGVPDPQWVPVPRPLPPDVFDGPIATTLTANLNPGATSGAVQSINRFSNGDPIGIILDSGDVFRTTLTIAPTGSTLTWATPLPGPAASGNQVVDEVSYIPPTPYANNSGAGGI